MEEEKGWISLEVAQVENTLKPVQAGRVLYKIRVEGDSKKTSHLVLHFRELKELTFAEQEWSTLK